VLRQIQYRYANQVILPWYYLHYPCFRRYVLLLLTIRYASDTPTVTRLIHEPLRHKLLQPNTELMSNDLLSPVSCPICRTEYQPIRVSQKFCSTNCRVKNNRRPKLTRRGYLPHPPPIRVPLQKRGLTRSGALSSPLTTGLSLIEPFPDLPPVHHTVSRYAQRGRLIGWGLGLLTMALVWEHRRKPIRVPFALLLFLIVVIPVYIGYWLGEYFGETTPTTHEEPTLVDCCPTGVEPLAEDGFFPNSQCSSLSSVANATIINDDETADGSLDLMAPVLPI